MATPAPPLYSYPLVRNRKLTCHITFSAFIGTHCRVLRPHAPPHFIVNLDLTLKHEIFKFEKGASDKNSQTGAKSESVIVSSFVSSFEDSYDMV